MFQVAFCSHVEILFIFTSAQLWSFLCLPVELSVMLPHALLQIFCVFWTGFSDPYCLLTILEDEEESRTRRSRAKPCKSVVKDAVSDDKIYQTDIKKQTLNPIWNQTFIVWVYVCNVFMYVRWTWFKIVYLKNLSFWFREFGDIVGASFHLEMWWGKHPELHCFCFKISLFITLTF